MGHTRKRNYDRYTPAYKLQAVKLANHPDVRSKDVAESLGIHPVMLYRFQMEHRRGEMKENKHMKPVAPSAKPRPDRVDHVRGAVDNLAAAEALGLPVAASVLPALSLSHPAVRSRHHYP